MALVLPAIPIFQKEKAVNIDFHEIHPVFFKCWLFGKTKHLLQLLFCFLMSVSTVREPNSSKHQGIRDYTETDQTGAVGRRQVSRSYSRPRDSSEASLPQEHFSF